MSTYLVKTISGRQYAVYRRETEYERIVMITDQQGNEHSMRRPRSFDYTEILQELLEEVENEQ